jgi:two-component system nitrate/nitrite response regulator NarL
MISTENARAQISVLIAHPSALSAELMTDAFSRQAPFKVVACAHKVSEVVQGVLAKTVNVALISVKLQDSALGGFAALRQVRELCPDVRSVMLLDAPDPALVVDAFRAGARGVFCPPQSDFKTMCLCVDRVHAGQIWANTDELGFVMEAFAQLAPLRVVNAAGLQLLAKREVEVVRLVAEGLTNRDIARELGLSEHTIKNYLFRIFDKLGVSSRVELALYVVSSTNRPEVAEASKRVTQIASLSTAD